MVVRDTTLKKMKGGKKKKVKLVRILLVFFKETTLCYLLYFYGAEHVGKVMYIDTNLKCLLENI